MTGFLVLSKADGSDWTLVCADQRVAATDHGFSVIDFSVDAPTRGFARAAWDAQRGNHAVNYSGRATDDSHGLESLTDRERDAVVRLVAALVDEDREALEAAGAFEPPGSDPYLWTHEYGRWGRVHLVMPPGGPRHWSGGVIRFDGSSGLGVIVDMWTDEEGPSDLSLEADVLTVGGATRAYFRGLHVM